MLEGHELLERYRTVVGELERDGHIKFEKPGKFSSGVKSVNFAVNPVGKKLTYKELDKRFGRVVEHVNVAGELIDALDDHTSRTATLPRTKKALANLREIHLDLRGQLIRYFQGTLEIAQNMGKAQSEVGRTVVTSGIFTNPVGGRGVVDFDGLAEIAARHLKALKVQKHEVER